MKDIADWEKIVLFVHNYGDYVPQNSEILEKRYEKYLRSADVYFLAMALVNRELESEKIFTLGDLARLCGEKKSSVWKFRKAKIRDRFLPIIGDHYGLVDYDKTRNSRGYIMCYRIRATKKLIEFFKGS